jgi:hypothetical protein
MNRYTELLHTHYKSSVLDSLPEWLRNMDDKTSNTADMGMFSSTHHFLLSYRLSGISLSLPDIWQGGEGNKSGSLADGQYLNLIRICLY